MREVSEGKAINEALYKEEHQSFLHVKEEVPSIKSVPFFDVGPFTVSNTTTTMMLIVLIVVLIVSALKKKMVPGTFQGLVEMFYESVVSFVEQIVGDKETAVKITPYVGSLLVFLIISNLLPLMPLVGAVNLDHVPFFRGTTTDFNTTFALALTVVVLMQAIGMKSQGVFGYLSHFIQIKQVVQGFKKGFGSGAVSIVNFLVGIIEIIGELSKILSLSLRLFGNMFAHEVLTVILLGAFAYAVPALWMGMGLLVGVVQSLVFVSLATVYFSLVAKKH